MRQPFPTKCRRYSCAWRKATGGFAPQSTRAGSSAAAVMVLTGPTKLPNCPSGPYRVVAAFNGDFFDQIRPNALLGHHCLCCGRALTDPVSQARFIGPECFGSASKAVLWIIDLSAPEDQAA
jgi:Family of unknown function (DUF6011)